MSTAVKQLGLLTVIDRCTVLCVLFSQIWKFWRSTLNFLWTSQKAVSILSFLMWKAAWQRGEPMCSPLDTRTPPGLWRLILNSVMCSSMAITQFPVMSAVLLKIIILETYHHKKNKTNRNAFLFKVHPPYLDAFSLVCGFPHALTFSHNARVGYLVTLDFEWVWPYCD